MLKIQLIFILFLVSLVSIAQDTIISTTKTKTKKDSIPELKNTKLDSLKNTFSKKDSLSAEKKQNHLDSLIAEHKKKQDEKKGKKISEEERIQDSINKVKKDSTRRANSLIKTKIHYASKDYVKINQTKKKIFIYDEAKIDYGSMNMAGGIVTIDYQNHLVYGGQIPDSTGQLNQRPIFKQQANVIKPDSLNFNYKTKKAYIWSSRTTQKDGTKLKSNRLKKVNDSLYYMNETKITTSTDLDNPEYYFRVRKAKMVPNKKMITRATNMYIADVPTPLWIPFAYFPLSTKSVSGIIVPTFGQGGDRGYFFQNGGYYIAFRDRFDLKLTGDYYSNASYGVRLQSVYLKKYKFRGGFNLRYENLVLGERGFNGYSKSTIYNIQWRHSSDSKAAPNSSFTASVNLGSSTYYRQSLNQLNTPNFLNNTLSSSITLTKNFPAYPSIRTSTTLTHNQNNNTKEVNMTFPTLQASMERVYPFAPKTGTKKGFIKNINFQYNMNAQNRLKTYDSLMFTSKMFDKSEAGMQQKIPVNTNFKVFKYFSVNLGGNYEEVWSLESIKYNDYDPTTKKAKKDTISGFNRFGKYNLTSSVGTTVYGMFSFGSDRKIQAIRHTIRPSLNFSYTPSQEDLFDEYITNEAGATRKYTKFESGVYGSPREKASSLIGISLNNNFEAKVTEKDTTKIEPKKVMILNTLNFTSNYDIIADSLNWQPSNLNASTNLMKRKMNINFSATLDPYAITQTGSRFNKLNKDNGGSFFRLTRASLNFSYSISSKNFKSLKAKTPSINQQGSNLQSGGRNDGLFGQSMQFGNNQFSNQRKTNTNQKEENKPYYNWKIPWKLRLTQAISYTNTNRESKVQANSLMFSGGFEPAPRWSISFNSGYDFDKKGFTYTQINFERDLKSWRMSFSWTPLNPNPTWYFFIGIKASVFRDIKWEERGKPDRQL